MARIEDLKYNQDKEQEKKQALQNNLISNCGEEIGNSIFQWIGGFGETPEARAEGRRFLAESLETYLKSPNFKVRQRGIELFLTAVDVRIENALRQAAFWSREPVFAMGNNETPEISSD